MKRVFLLIMFSLFMIVNNATGADLTGCWAGSMICSGSGAGDGYQVIEIEQHPDTGVFEVLTTSDNEICGGVVDGNKFYMSCDGGNSSIPSFAYGEVKGKTLYVINHVPADGKACKGIYEFVPCTEPIE